MQESVQSTSSYIKMRRNVTDMYRFSSGDNSKQPSLEIKRVVNRFKSERSPAVKPFQSSYSVVSAANDSCLSSNSSGAV